MKIERLEIIAFGKLKNKTIDLSDGINIIYGGNESGKSTTINFIYAMLYGFGESRTKALSLREKYTPWDGGVCEGKMIISTDDGRILSIYRKAGNVKKYDILHVHDTQNGEELFITPEEIIGIGSETFLKTLCIRQLGSSFDGSNDEILQRLSNISTGGDEGVSFEKAQKIIDALRREIQPQRGSGGLYAETTRKINEEEHKKIERKQAESELSSLSKHIAEENKRAEKISMDLFVLSKLNYESAIAHLDGRIEEIEKAKGKKISILSLMLLAAFLLMLFINKILSLIPLVLFIVSVIFTGKPKNADEKERLLTQRSKLLTQKEIDEKKALELKMELEKISERIMGMKIREKTLGMVTEKSNDNLEELYKKRSGLDKKLKILGLSSRALASAYANMQKNFTPTLNNKASDYFSIISGGKYSRIFCDKDFSVSIESTIPRESGFFSGGTVDQLYLSLRLALIDMIFAQNNCPVILDQPFLQYDDTRKENTLSLFESIKKNRQIIIFTADKSMNGRNI